MQRPLKDEHMSAANNTVEIDNWETVCQFDELKENIGVCVLVDKKQIAIFRMLGSKELYAIDNHDPFSNANVISRGICGDIKGQPIVASPIYKQHFDLITGRCLEDDSVILQTYLTRVVDGCVQVAKQ
jgi:NAD(P)H-dependent nitrite reductase small subunit